MSSASAARFGTRVEPVIIPTDVMLPGELTIPADASGIVAFAADTDSGRVSPPSQRVARDLQAGGFATLVCDLLTADEDSLDARTEQFRFDVALLADRLGRITDWLGHHVSTVHLGIGYFGTGTRASAALTTAATRPAAVKAIVCADCWRPDLAAMALRRVRAPTLLVAGGANATAVEMGKAAISELGTKTKVLEVVSGVDAVMEQPTVDRVCDLAAEWFTMHLAGAPVPGWRVRPCSD